MFIFGAAGAAAVGQADISDVMIAQGLLLPAIVEPRKGLRSEDCSGKRFRPPADWRVLSLPLS